MKASERFQERINILNAQKQNLTNNIQTAQRKISEAETFITSMNNMKFGRGLLEGRGAEASGNKPKLAYNKYVEILDYHTERKQKLDIAITEIQAEIDQAYIHRDNARYYEDVLTTQNEY
jgi:hypothetical protein